MKGGTTAFALSTKTKMVAGIAAAVLAVSMSTAAMQTEDAWAAAYEADGGNAADPIVVATAAVPADGTTVVKGDTWFVAGTSNDGTYGWHQAGSSWTYIMDKTVVSKAGDLAAADPTGATAGNAAFSTTAAPVTGFVKIKNAQQSDEIYYFNNQGIMQTGWQQITLTSVSPSDSGKAWYYFRPNGEMVDGEWVLYNGEWYYMYATGDVAIKKYNEAVTWASVGIAPQSANLMTVADQVGQMNTQTAMYQAANAAAPAKTYFFNTANGAMARNYMLTDTKQLPVMWICDDGSLLTEANVWIQTSNGDWYVTTTGGNIFKATTDEIATNTVDNVQYYFNKKGVMQTGWINAGTAAKAVWYYANSNGVVQTNTWVEYAGQWFWMGNDGKMATSQWVDDGQYYVGKDGAWIPTQDNAPAADDSTVSENPYNI